MKRNDYFLEQLVTPADLDKDNQDRVDSDVEGNLLTRMISGGNAGGQVGTSVGGVLSAPVALDSSINLDALLVVKESTTQMRITAGSAMLPTGIIVTLDTDVFINLDDFTEQLDWQANGSGIARWVLLDYIEVASEPKVDRSGISHDTRLATAYRIRVTDVTGLPTLGVTSVLLASFVNGASFIIDGAITDSRTFVQSYTSDKAVYLNPSDQPFAGIETVADFIRSKGAGTPATNNPHGLTFDDIQGNGAADHFDDSHSPGILFLDGTSDNSWLIAYTSSEVNFTAPTANARIVIKGKRYTDALDPIPAATIEAAGNPGQTVYIIAKVSGDAVVSDVLSFSDYVSEFSKPAKDYVVIGYASVDPPTHDVENAQDIRQIRTLTQHDIRVDTTEYASDPNTTLSHLESDGLRENLNRIRYQIQAITGGASWKTAPALSLNTVSAADLPGDTVEEFTSDPSLPGDFSAGNPIDPSALLAENLGRIRHQIGMIVYGSGTGWKYDISAFGSLYQMARGATYYQWGVGRDANPPEYGFLSMRTSPPSGTVAQFGRLYFQSSDNSFKLQSKGEGISTNAELNHPGLTGWTISDLEVKTLTVGDGTNSTTLTYADLVALKSFAGI